MKEFIINYKTNIIYVIIIAYVIMSLLTFIFYAVDKKRAIANKWRIKESILLAMPWLFGSLGGLFGMYIIRHKTKHWYFVLNIILSFILTHALIIYILILK